MLNGSLDRVKSKENFERNTVSDWLYNLGLVVPAFRFADCGESGMGWVGICPQGHEVYHAFSCEQRICPSCAARRSAQMQQNLSPALLELVNNSPGEYGLKHIVFGTNVNLLDFMVLKGERALDADALNSVKQLAWALRGAVAKLMGLYSVAGVLANGSELQADVLGFGIGIEFGLLAGTLHFHVLALAKYLPQRDLSVAWEVVNHGHGSYVWIEAVGRDASDMDKAVGYISKYVTKPLNKRKEGVLHDETANTARMSAWVAKNGLESVMAALAYIFKGVRRFQTYGAFYGLGVDNDVPEVCSVCQQALVWVRELDLLMDGFAMLPAADELLKTFRTNKFCGFGSSPPSDCPVQMRFEPF